MGKMFFIILGFMGSVLTAYAQDKQDKELDSISMDSIPLVGIKYLEDSFSLIKPIDVPKAVYDVIRDYYPTATIKSAYVNKSGQYKLEIVLKNGRSGHLYADRDGNWIER
ncbi:MAG TPA: hypothetical protein VLZ54_01300 [Arenibacter sp.]|nr:hypothetical protein [Arenibacter sp.]